MKIVQQGLNIRVDEGDLTETVDFRGLEHTSKQLKTNTMKPCNIYALLMISTNHKMPFDML